MRATFSVQKDFYEISWNFLDKTRSLSKRLTGLFGSERVFVHVTMICVRGGVAKIKGTGKTRRKGAHDGLTSFSVHRNLVPPFTILSMTCQFMVPQQ